MSGASDSTNPSAVESAVDRVDAVARALTSTTRGVLALQREVVGAAALIAGGDASAALALRDGDQLRVTLSASDVSGLTGFERWEAIPEVLAGHRVRRTVAGQGSLLVLPMSYHGEIVGALGVTSRSDAPADSGTEDVLAILASNAAIAMENARLYELEKESVRRLRELDAMKTDFLSTVQHELRTPLTAILGLSDLIEMCWEIWDDPPKLDALRDIQVAASNLDSIVETIIDFSAGDGEAPALALSDVPLDMSVRTAIDVVGERHKGGLPVPVDVEVNAGVTVLADRDRLGQVLRALIDNAVKFSDGSGRVVVRGMRADPGTVLIEVIDQGIGIPEQDLARIFDRFFQVDNTATRRFGGTGMGLALAKRIVEAHDATIGVETALGAGTTIALRWPEGAEKTTVPAEPQVASSVPVQ